MKQLVLLFVVVAAILLGLMAFVGITNGPVSSANQAIQTHP
jgi:hypothetical protein